MGPIGVWGPHENKGVVYWPHGPAAPHPKGPMRAKVLEGGPTETLGEAWGPSHPAAALGLPWGTPPSPLYKEGQGEGCGTLLGALVANPGLTPHASPPPPLAPPLP